MSTAQRLSFNYLIPTISAIAILISCNVSADEVHSFNFSGFKVSNSEPYKAALYALLNRGWELDNFDKQQASAHLPDKDVWIQISFDQFPVVKIASTGGAPPKQKWLEYLETDMTLRLFSCP